MAKITKALAREIAPKIRDLSGPAVWDQARDQVDALSAGDLDTWQLDTLTDWVMDEIANGDTR